MNWNEPADRSINHDSSNAPDIGDTRGALYEQNVSTPGGRQSSAAGSVDRRASAIGARGLAPSSLADKTPPATPANTPPTANEFSFVTNEKEFVTKEISFATNGKEFATKEISFATNGKEFGAKAISFGTTGKEVVANSISFAANSEEFITKASKFGTNGVRFLVQTISDTSAVQHPSQLEGLDHIGPLNQQVASYFKHWPESSIPGHQFLECLRLVADRVPPAGVASSLND